mmetsp:Transcript_13438/g.29459  ORF Transcript_13438/g.29459 Transcript_13438/m.29459 type:complete len:301 (-) Transcript_13438:45-947(-)
MSGGTASQAVAIAARSSHRGQRHHVTRRLARSLPSTSSACPAAAGHRPLHSRRAPPTEASTTVCTHHSACRVPSTSSGVSGGTTSVADALAATVPPAEANATMCPHHSARSLPSTSSCVSGGTTSLADALAAAFPPTEASTAKFTHHSASSLTSTSSCVSNVTTSLADAQHLKFSTDPHHDVHSPLGSQLAVHVHMHVRLHHEEHGTSTRGLRHQEARRTKMLTRHTACSLLSKFSSVSNATTRQHCALLKAPGDKTAMRHKTHTPGAASLGFPAAEATGTGLTDRPGGGQAFPAMQVLP